MAEQETNGTSSSAAATTTNNNNTSKKRRRGRWGDAPPPSKKPAVEGEVDNNANPPSTNTPTTATATTATTDGTAGKKRRNRFSSSPPPPPSSSSNNSAQAKADALKLSISQRLAAIKARKKATATTTTATTKEAASAKPTTDEPVKKKAKVYDLDLSVTTPLFKEEKEEQKKKEEEQKKNPYLAHLETETPSANDEKAEPSKEEEENEVLLDSRLAGGHTTKTRTHHKSLTFVEPGTFIKLAERKRSKAKSAEAAGYASGRKEGSYTKIIGMGDVVDDSGGDDSKGKYGAGEAGLELGLSGRLVPRADAPEFDEDGVAESIDAMPYVLEWWDMELLPSKLRKEIGVKEGKALAAKTKRRMDVNLKKEDDKTDEEKKESKKKESEMLQKLTTKCFNQASLHHSKTSKLIQHPIPIKAPGHSNLTTPTPVLHLTKKEMKRQRKRRRAERQREIQDMQAAGLLPPPEPRLTLSNFMKVLGDQAVLDPSQMEAKVTEQIHARKIKHEKMNAERKLTKDQRSEKRKRKLAEDTANPNVGISIALFLIKDMSHKYHRTKVDLNAQQNNITGGVLECECPKLALVVAEGGPKAIRRFTRLMTVRMKWRGENFTGDSDDEEDHPDEDQKMTDADEKEETKATTQKFNPNNTCDLVWTGMGTKRMFHNFSFQSCTTSEAARKVLEARGVAHFWDQVLVHASGRAEEFHFKLGGGGGEGKDNGGGKYGPADDVVMKDA